MILCEEALEIPRAHLPVELLIPQGDLELLIPRDLELLLPWSHLKLSSSIPDTPDTSPSFLSCTGSTNYNC